jgi:LysM repeat protein
MCLPTAHVALQENIRFDPGSRYFMKQNAPLFLQARCAAALLVLLVLIACAPPAPSSPRPTAPVVLDITVAPTQDVDATATAYARQLVPTPTPAGLYVVQQGDTLGGLAEDFGTTVEDLMAANGLTDANAIQAGQTLLIPSLISGTLALGTPAPLAGTSAPTATATLTTTATLPTATPADTTPARAKPTVRPAKPTEIPTPTLASP